MTLDPYQLSLLVQSHSEKLLQITDGKAGFTCAICGAEQEPWAWRVRLPARAGHACPGCADDTGFEVQ